MARKRWKTVASPSGAELLHASETKAYTVVNAARADYLQRQQDGSTSVITDAVQVFEYDPASDRWHVFDIHDFTAGE